MKISCLATKSLPVASVFLNLLLVSKARTRQSKVPQNTEVRVVPRRRFVAKMYKTPPQVIYKTTKKKRVMNKKGF